MTTKCAICKKEGTDVEMTKYTSPDGLVTYYHKGDCLDLHIKWELYESEE